MPAQFKRHAHHWLILHGRYVCIARKPEMRAMRGARALPLSGQDGGGKSPPQQPVQQVQPSSTSVIE